MLNNFTTDEILTELCQRLGIKDKDANDIAFIVFNNPDRTSTVATFNGLPLYDKEKDKHYQGNLVINRAKVSIEPVADETNALFSIIISDETAKELIADNKREV